MDKRVYIKTKQLEFDGVLPEEKIDQFLKDFLKLQKFKKVVKGQFELDSDFSKREHYAYRNHKETIGGIKILIWEKGTPRPRENNEGIFQLRADYTVPTNDSMYECIDCKEVGRPHEIKKGSPNRVLSDVYKSDFLGRYNYSRGYSGWYRICTGCGKHDGPWSHCGDD